MAAVNTELMPVLAIYFPDFQAKFKDALPEIAREYASRLVKHGIGQLGLRRGIERLKEKSVDIKWSPNPEQFALMCQLTAEDIGAPSLKDTIQELVAAQNCLIRTGKPHQFSHQIVELISQRIGPKIKESYEKDLEKLIKPEYDHFLKLAIAGELPEPRMALEQQAQEPDKPEWYQEYTDEELAENPLVSRLQKLRKDADQ